MWKKLNEPIYFGVNGDLQNEAYKIKDEVLGNCEKCGEFLFPRTGMFKEDKLFCNLCLEIKL